MLCVIIGSYQQSHKIETFEVVFKGKDSITIQRENSLSKYIVANIEHEIEIIT